MQVCFFYKMFCVVYMREKNISSIDFVKAFKSFDSIITLNEVLMKRTTFMTQL